MGTRVAASWPAGTFSRTVGRAYIPRKSHGFDISCPAAQAGRLAEATKKPSWKPDSSSPCGSVDTYQIIEVGLMTLRDICKRTSNAYAEVPLGELSGAFRCPAPGARDLPCGRRLNSISPKVTAE